MHVGVVKGAPKAPRLGPDILEGMEVLGGVGKLVVMPVMRGPPDDPLLRIGRGEKSLEELRRPQIFLLRAGRADRPLQPRGDLVLEGAVGEIPMPEPGDEKHPPIDVEQADAEHDRPREKPVRMRDSGRQLVKRPAQPEDAQQIDDEKAALVDHVPNADPFPRLQLVLF